MGNTSSTRHSHDDSVDGGHLSPQGVYTGPQDWNQQVVAQLIIDRKLAPFYRPLEDYDESWDSDRILLARKDPATSTHPEQPSPSDPLQSLPTPRPSTIKHSRGPSPKDSPRVDEAAIYKGAVECPICFLYYPPNINRSRCCDHPICTECFVQIKRSEPSPTHLSSEPACCPYCVQDNFGVTYEPPPWRSGVGSENFSSPRQEALQPSGSVPHTIRRKSFGADAPEVVITDQIRPDWEDKLAAVRAAVQRRANRRIIMRQVGDRLVPVGITSGRIHAIGQDLPGGPDHPSAENRGSRRRRNDRGGQGMDVGQFLGLSGQDIEELIVMEAMRLSLAEHEEAQRRQESESNSQSNTGSPQSDRSPIPMSYVLTKPKSSDTRDNGSPGSGRELAASSSSAGGGNLGVPGTSPSPSQSLEASRPSRPPSPRPEGSSSHQRAPSALASLVAGSAAIAGLMPDDTTRADQQRLDLNPSEDPPKEASSTSTHMGAASTAINESASQGLSQNGHVPPISPEGDSSTGQVASGPSVNSPGQLKEQEATMTCDS